MSKINRALEEVAIEHRAKVVFMSSTVAVNTPYVVDITAEVAAKIK